MGDYTIFQHILMTVGAVGGLLIIWKAFIPFIGKVFGWMQGKNRKKPQWRHTSAVLFSSIPILLF